MDFFAITYFQKYDFLSNNSREPEHMITLEYENWTFFKKVSVTVSEPNGSMCNLRIYMKVIYIINNPSIAQ